MKAFAYFWMTVFIAVFAVTLSAQIHTPVKWTTAQQQVSDNEFDLIFNAKIDDGWNIYSQYLESDDGPVRTSFEYEKGDHFELVGKTDEKGKRKEGFDDLFGMNVIKFSDKVVFTQRVKVNDFSKPIVGYYEFMTCDATKCLPPEAVDFEFTLTPKTGAATTPAPETPKKDIEKIADTQPTPPVAPTTPVQPEAQLEKDKINNTVKKVKQKNEAIAEKVTTPAKTAAAPKETVTETAETTAAVIDQPQSGILEPVKWNAEIQKISDDEYEVIYEAKVDDGWSIYSQFLESEDGPQATEFNYDEPKTYELVGKAQESSKYRQEGFDKLFEMNVIKFKKNVRFIQRVKVKNHDEPVKGFLLYMTCDDTQCLPPTDVPFYVTPATGQAFLGAKADELTAAYAGGGTTTTSGNTAVNPGSPVTAKIDGDKIDQKIATIESTYKAPLGDCGAEDNAAGQNMFWTFILGFAGGLFALLTPCVFPMIPLTVSFFTAGSKDRATGIKNGLIYGASIIVIYVSIGLFFTAMFGPEVLNFLSTHWIPNLLFFLIFVFFAISFFGYFEITLPSSWTNKTDAMADKGGLIGTFFMAFTLALVSFSCTGPIIGTALVQSATNPLGPFVVMLGFSTALALPFGLFAAFPAWLNSLPSSGGWMNSVKVVLGFLELAFAFKFLSVADMTEHWGFLRYDLFLAIWVLLALGLTLYLFGYVKFPHDSPVTKRSPIRSGFAIASLALTLYLATGFTLNDKTKSYNSLPLLSGIAPPASYNFLLDKEESDEDIKSRYNSFTKCANDLDCFKDYYEGMTYAREVNKPVLLDFTGFGCVNCRKTEEHIWIEDQVWSKINDDYVLISLYVDDRKKLDNIYISKYTNKKLRNVGNKWTDFQIVNFQQNSQPLYVLMSPDEEVMAAPRGYKEGVQDYADFLDCGLSTFKSLKGGTSMR